MNGASLTWATLALMAISPLAGCGSDFSGGGGGSGGATGTQTGQGGFTGCQSDAACDHGKKWCDQGFCVVCDNSGQICDVSCSHGWLPYQRNGCSPCDCAPPNECTSDADCPSSGGTAKCYAGKMCWDWCPPDDPSCCFGNVCGQAGCGEPNPAGCFATGCAPGESCLADGCAPSGCSCDGGGWQCDSDCSGGTCAP